MASATVSKAKEEPSQLQAQPLQRKADSSPNTHDSHSALNTALPAQRKADSASHDPTLHTHTQNSSGLPPQLKAGIESMSGLSMDDVTVHYNSDKPAQLQAHAYAQGTDIHLASGQEKHLPHEAWHVVQQKQGRVSATVFSPKLDSRINNITHLQDGVMKPIQFEIIAPPRGTLVCAYHTWMDFAETRDDLPLGIWGNQQIRDIVNDYINQFDWIPAQQVVDHILMVWNQQNIPEGHVLGGDHLTPDQIRRVRTGQQLNEVDRQMIELRSQFGLNLDFLDP
ncbi:MAG: DUF4157 domain-containing protein [Bacteroidota bacterium]